MTEKKVAALLLKQHALTDSLKENMRIFKERSVGIPNEGYVKAKLAGLESLWGDFKANHKQLVTAFTEETLKDEDYFKAHTYSQTEDLFCECSAYYRDLLPDPNEAADKVENDVKPKLKLPIISIPTYDGSLQEWCNFRNLFRTLIHDRADISEIKK